MDIVKFPRTPHVEGSRVQAGDEDLQIVPLASLWGKHIVVEEKIDGANSGMSFDPARKLHLQSRGHLLTGGPRETQFTLFKQWAATHADRFRDALGDRYVAYGEWMYTKHTVFYDRLPHYWMEFDVLDKDRSDLEAYGANRHDVNQLWFLDTPSRAALLNGLPYVAVRVLWSGIWLRGMRFEGLMKPSHFKSPQWRGRLQREVANLGYDWDLIWTHTDHSNLMEGVYIKWEENGRVMGRYKFIRADFISLIADDQVHCTNLPTTRNVLADGVNLFAF